MSATRSQEQIYAPYIPPPPIRGVGVVAEETTVAEKKDEVLENTGVVCQTCNAQVKDNDYVATGMYKNHVKCGDCNRREATFKYHGLQQEVFDTIPEMQREGFYQECAGKSGKNLVAFAKQALEKFKTEEMAAGVSRKWRPMKFYTDMGYKEENIRRSALFKVDERWGELFQVPLDFEVDQIKSGTTRVERLTSERKGAAMKATRTGQRKGATKCPSADTFAQWTEEQCGAWTAEVGKQADHITQTLTDMKAKPGFKEAPALISDEVQALERAITEYATSAKSPLGDLSQEFVQKLGDFAMRKRNLMSQANSFFKVYDKLHEAKLDILILNAILHLYKFKKDGLQNLMGE